MPLLCHDNFKYHFKVQLLVCTKHCAVKVSEGEEVLLHVTEPRH